MSFSRDHILAELKRTASDNGGTALGSIRFAKATGIRESDWKRYWPRFSDAQKAAGLTHNRKTPPIPDDAILEALARLTRDLGHRPTAAEIAIAKRSDPSVPSSDAYLRLGNFEEITQRLREFAAQRPEFSDIVALLPAPMSHDTKAPKDSPFTGSVYMLKSGRHYKIGHSNATGRRERELAIQLPERAQVVHEIKTDDPTGIEKYWHGRFAEKRLNGEWFQLSPDDVSAFKRRKFM